MFSFTAEKIERSSKISKKDSLRIRESMASQGPTINIGGLILDNPMHNPYHQQTLALDRWQRKQTLPRKVFTALRIRKPIPCPV